MRHYACAILLDEERILLGKRAPHRKAYPGCWDVIGGRVAGPFSSDYAVPRASSWSKLTALV
jgi:8-oxo-dGTP diphosphatase